MNKEEALDQAMHAINQANPYYASFCKLDISQDMSEEARNLLFYCFSTKLYEANTCIYKAGKKSKQRVHLILQGKVAISSPANEEFAILKKGDVFGLFSFLDDERKHSVSAHCKKDCQILTLDRAFFDIVCLEHPALGNQLLRFMFRLLSRMALKLENEYVAMHQFALGKRN